MLLGCIADDFTGASDLANTLARGGMNVVQFNGVPDEAAASAAEAGVVALKSRTVPPDEAVAQSLAALRWLQTQGCRQFLFKYCSTFDSTPQGNIGPVLDALSEALSADRVAVCPAFPATGRTIYQGHLFVGDRLLNESGMENHPLTPMRDADIRRWLGHQTACAVGHVACAVVARGAAAIGEAMAAEAGAGRRYIVIDAVREADLAEIGRALADDVLVSGGSGIALGLPENFRRMGLLSSADARWRGSDAPAAALCGSCSVMSRRQIEHHRAAGGPALAVDAGEIVSGTATAAAAAAWARDNAGGARVPLVYSSAEPAVVARVQQEHGKAATAEAIEHFFAELARLLVADGVRNLIVAGGETAGAVVSGLDISAFEIGPEIDPGVPALKAAGGQLALALKSGNFGATDFFAKAGAVLAGRKGAAG